MNRKGKTKQHKKDYKEKDNFRNKRKSIKKRKKREIKRRILHLINKDITSKVRELIKMTNKQGTRKMRDRQNKKIKNIFQKIICYRSWMKRRNRLISAKKMNSNPEIKIRQQKMLLTRGPNQVHHKIKQQNKKDQGENNWKESKIKMEAEIIIRRTGSLHQ